MDNYMFNNEEILHVSLQSQTTSKSITTTLEIINFLKTLEPNDQKWPDYLEKCACTFTESHSKLSTFEENHPKINNYLKTLQYTSSGVIGKKQPLMKKFSIKLS